MARITYKNYMLWLLMLTTTVNSLDRIVFPLVQESIRQELHLTDTQVGLISGVAFGLFSTVTGILFGRWADRGNRAKIAGAVTAMWAVVVGLCGLATSFTQVLILRSAAAIGDTGYNPPAHSLIAETFDRAERPRALSIFMLSNPLTALIASIGGGWIAQLFGWRVLFLALAVPGLIFAALNFVTLREPRCAGAIADQARNAGDAAEGENAASYGWWHVISTLWANRTFRLLWISTVSASSVGIAIAAWMPTYFIRTFGLSIGVIGSYSGLVFGFGGMLATYLGGVLAARFAANNERLQLRIIAVLLFSGMIGSICMYLAPSHYVAFALMIPITLAGLIGAGPMMAMIHALIETRMRARAIAILFMSANLIGWGLGPFAAGVLSDFLNASGADQPLRYTILILTCCNLIPVALQWRASATVHADIRSTIARDPEATHAHGEILHAG